MCACSHRNIHGSMHTCTHACVIYRYIACTPTPGGTCTHMYLHGHVHAYIHARVCMYVCMRCVHVHTHADFTSTHTHACSCHVHMALRMGAFFRARDSVHLIPCSNGTTSVRLYMKQTHQLECLASARFFFGVNPFLCPSSVSCISTALPEFSQKVLATVYVCNWLP